MIYAMSALLACELLYVYISDIASKFKKSKPQSQPQLRGTRAGSIYH